MTRAETLLSRLQFKHHATWTAMQNLFPTLKTHATPKAEINNRLKTTAGRAWYDSFPQKCDYSFEMLDEHTEEMLDTVVPHELAHCAAWVLFKEPGHGPDWKYVMCRIGQAPERTHNMVTRRMQAKMTKR